MKEVRLHSERDEFVLESGAIDVLPGLGMGCED